MKIAYLLGSLNRGGTETLLLDIFRNISKEHLDIVCVYRMGGVLLDEFKDSKVSLIKISHKGRPDLSYIFRLRSYLKRSKIEIVHSHQPVDALYAWLACIGLKTKLVFTIHGFDFSYGKLTGRVQRFIQKKTDFNLFVSKMQRNYFMEELHFRRKNTSVLYNGVSFERLDNFQKSSIRQEFNIPETRLLLGSVGSFGPGRDQMTICRFLDLLNKGGHEFIFVFAGAQNAATPWYWDDCVDFCNKNGLSEKVVFAGLRQDIPNFLSQLDAFIYSTNNDTFGIAIIEAMYMSTPIFINDWKVFEEITGQGKHGNFYHTKDENDLLNKFMLFLPSRKIFDEKAKRDSEWVKEQYSIQNHIQNLLKIYQSVLTK